MSCPKLSVVVVAFNMARELPRTIRTLSPLMQRDIGSDEYEIIVVDNGSTEPLDVPALLRMGSNISFHRIADASVSPVAAVNHGLSRARGRLVGVMIDGARMASPRLLATALDAASLHPRPVIGTLAFHLGPEMQLRSVANGYCQEVEDRLLESVAWEQDSYNLFSISVFAGSSADGWFVLPAETNALFLTREQWAELGGYDPEFRSPGGGLANLDTWARACALPGAHPVLLLGEGTFHQVHGGIATNAQKPMWDTFHDEYVRLRGRSFERPGGTPLLVGRLHPAALPSVAVSIERLRQLRAEGGAPGGSSRSELPPDAEAVQGRPFRSSLGASVLDQLQAGAMRMSYRGVPFLKNPLDIALYTQLLGRLSPRTVIEIGTKHGGSALWFADMLTAKGEPGARVVSVDIAPLAAFSDERITFLKGDAKRLGEVLTEELLARCAHPWLVVEDSSHLMADTLATLEFFHPRLRPGDYIVVEDGILSQFSDPMYRRYENGPNRGLTAFLGARGNEYAIDGDLCDHFGYNATGNPNGWLRRLGPQGLHPPDSSPLEAAAEPRRS